MPHDAHQGQPFQCNALQAEDALRASRQAESKAKKWDLLQSIVEAGLAALLLVVGIVADKQISAKLAVVSVLVAISQRISGARVSLWVRISAIHRANFERVYFGLPAALLESVSSNQAKKLAEKDRSRRPEATIENWFDTPAEAHNRIRALRESLLFGALLRRRWRWVVVATGSAVGAATLLYGYLMWPLYSWDYLPIISAILLEVTVVARITALQSYIATRELVDRSLSIAERVAYEPLIFATFHERVCQARRRKPLVPTWFYILNRAHVGELTSSILRKNQAL